MIVVLRLVGVRRNRRDRPDEVNRLLEALFEREVVGIVVRIERIGEEDRAGKGVHEILRGMLHDGIVLEPVRELAIGAELLIPVGELSLRRKLSAQQQVSRLLVAKAALSLVRTDNVLDVDSAIEKLAGNSLLLAFGHHISMNISNGRQSHQNAGAVIIAQAALYTLLRVQSRIDVVNRTDLFGLLFEPFFVYHCLCSYETGKLYQKICATKRNNYPENDLKSPFSSLRVKAKGAKDASPAPRPT